MIIFFFADDQEENKTFNTLLAVIIYQEENRIKAKGLLVIIKPGPTHSKVVIQKRQDAATNVVHLP